MDCKELIVEEKMQKKIDIKAILKKLNISRFIFILLHHYIIMQTKPIIT